jgi:hypothetical protein
LLQATVSSTAALTAMPADAVQAHKQELQHAINELSDRVMFPELQKKIAKRKNNERSVIAKYAHKAYKKLFSSSKKSKADDKSANNTRMKIEKLLAKFEQLKEYNEILKELKTDKDQGEISSSVVGSFTESEDHIRQFDSESTGRIKNKKEESEDNTIIPLRPMPTEDDSSSLVVSSTLDEQSHKSPPESRVTRIKTSPNDPSESSDS